MRNYPLTAKEQHKRKEKLAKIRQTVMIILMVIAGIYYLTVEHSQVTNAAVVMNVKDAPVKPEDVNPIAAKKGKKFTIEGFLESTSAPNEVKDTETKKEISIHKQTEAVTVEITTTEQHSVPQDSVDAGRITQAVPDIVANVEGVSATEIQTAPVADTAAFQTEDKRVNLNTATLEELDALPGVGPSTAKNIIAYREAHGGFAAPEEIMNVKRIGEKTFQKLKEFIKV